MHALSFQMKRCHLSAVRVGKKIFRGTTKRDDPDFDGVVDMTPARFDILYLVYGQGPASSNTPGSIEMTTLRDLLGLAPSTISEAVGRLIELELLTSEYASWDGRKKVVRLTAKGLARLKQALFLVFNGRQLERHYNDFVASPHNPTRPRQKPMRPWRIVDRLRAIYGRLEALARHLFDDSAEVYELHGSPGDD